MYSTNSTLIKNRIFSHDIRFLKEKKVTFCSSNERTYLSFPADMRKKIV